MVKLATICYVDNGKEWPWGLEDVSLLNLEVLGWRRQGDPCHRVIHPM